MSAKLLLQQRWVLFVARHSHLVPRWLYIPQLTLSLLLFLMWHYGARTEWMAYLFLFLAIVSFEWSGFAALLQSKDAEIAQLRSKLEGTA